MVATRQSSGHAGSIDGPSTSGGEGRSKPETTTVSNTALFDLPPELLDKIFGNFKYKQISQLRSVKLFLSMISNRNLCYSIKDKLCEFIRQLKLF